MDKTVTEITHEMKLRKVKYYVEEVHIIDTVIDHILEAWDGAKDKSNKLELDASTLIDIENLLGRYRLSIMDRDVIE